MAPLTLVCLPYLFFPAQDPLTTYVIQADDMPTVAEYAEHIGNAQDEEMYYGNVILPPNGVALPKPMETLEPKLFFNNFTPAPLIIGRHSLASCGLPFAVGPPPAALPPIQLPHPKPRDPNMALDEAGATNTTQLVRTASIVTVICFRVGGLAGSPQ